MFRKPQQFSGSHCTGHPKRQCPRNAFALCSFDGLTKSSSNSIGHAVPGRQRRQSYNANDTVSPEAQHTNRHDYHIDERIIRRFLGVTGTRYGRGEGAFVILFAAACFTSIGPRGSERQSHGNESGYNGSKRPQTGATTP